VLLPEVLEHIRVAPGRLCIDCTLGGGGHSKAMLEHGGRVTGIDRDTDAIEHARELLSDYGERFQAVNARFSDLAEVAGDLAGEVDGVLMDLGLSSHMIDDPAKGFSYRHDGPLDMNMGLGGLVASDIVNEWSERELIGIFRRFGEKRHAGNIARAVVRARRDRRITTTLDLAGIVESVVGGRKPQKSKARIFMALRIAVNDELDELRKGLVAAVDILKRNGRLCVISYHSLEDRIVKDFMREHADPCTCPPGLPMCSCGRLPDLRLVSRKPIKPTAKEIQRNPRSRSALLRVAEKVAAV